MINSNKHSVSTIIGTYWRMRGYDRFLKLKSSPKYTTKRNPVKGTEKEIAMLFKEIMLNCKFERKSQTDLSVRKVAQMLDKGENYVSAFENGRAFPSIRVFLKYLMLLGIDLTPLKRLRIQKAANRNTSNEAKRALIEKVYKLDDNQVGYLLAQEKIAEIYKMKKKS